MKNHKYKILAIIITIFFLSIKLSYNGTPPITIFTAFITLIYKSLGNGWDFKNLNLKTNYTYYLIEFLLVSFLLFFSIYMEKYKLFFFSLILFLFMWSIWIYMLISLIEFDIYIISSLPFLISLLTTIILLIYDYKKHKLPRSTKTYL